MLVIWAIIVILYVVTSYKTQFWQTFARLGMRAEVPFYYIKYSDIYHYISIAIFLISISMPIFVSNLTTYLIVIPPILAFLTGALSREKAFKEYRKILTGLLQGADEEEKTNLMQEIKKTDMELLDKIKVRIRL